MSAETFAFESDFVATLRCVPMAVRLKLDRCGIKLTLRQWSRFTRADREALLQAPCGAPAEVAAYRDRLVRLVTLRAGEVAKPLAEPATALDAPVEHPPPSVMAFAASKGLPPPSAAAWVSLSELQRFALVKLTRDNHDNVNFEPAMREFGLA